MISIGQVLNNTYKITDEIGSGGGGIVFKAYHLRLEKYVVVKLVRDEIKKKINDRSEVDILKNLKHEFLPQVIDFVEEENNVYTVMEFVEGNNFKELVEKGKRFSEKQVRKYAMQLIEAAEYLHHNDPPIIHSDIKPSNVMLTPQDNICLIDFNISIISDDGIAYSKGGSKGFAAPEQFRRIVDVPLKEDEFHERTRFVGNDEETEILINGKRISEIQTKDISKAIIDEKTDIYGIGATLYFILTSRCPSNGKADFRGVKCSTGIKAVISKAMRANPKKRYHNVKELKNAFKGISYKSVTVPLCMLLFVCVVGTVVTGFIQSNNAVDNIEQTESVVEDRYEADEMSELEEHPITSFENNNEEDEQTSGENLITIQSEPQSTLTSSQTQLNISTDNVTSMENYVAVEPASELVTIGENNYLIDTDKLDLSKQTLSNKDIAEIGKLTELYYLDISDNNISDISFLENMDKMMYLNLSNNSISDFSVIKKLKNLKQLVICENSISIEKVDFISNMEFLTSLTLDNNGIINIKEIKNLPMLTYISLNDNEISDIESLSGMPLLEEVEINYNPVKDLSPLYTLKNLNKVNMFGLFNSKWIDITALIEINNNMPNCLLGVMPVLMEYEDGRQMTDIIYYEGYFHFLDGTVWYNTGFDGNGVPTFMIFDFDLDIDLELVDE